MKDKKFIWLDLEMTGLDPERHHIVEIASIITDSDFKVIEEGPNLVVSQPMSVLESCDPIARKMHEKSGLWQEIQASNITTEEAALKTLAFFKKHLHPNESPMCGNTISQDRRFLLKYMPEVEAFFHYRHLDVSSFKILYDTLYPHAESFSYGKMNNHRAKDDIYESVAELDFYKKYMLLPN
ncbi:MAG: oligoribonuclease [Pseudomonadota bacterium]|nr:oligoribonuclease [Pseudomonadota bacterium]